MMIIENGFAVTLSMQNVPTSMGCIMNIDEPSSNHEQYLHPNITFLCQDIKAMEILYGRICQMQITMKNIIEKEKQNESIV